MKRTIMLVLALVLVGSWVLAQDTNGLPPAAVLELQKMEKFIADVKAKTVANLTVILKSETQKGNLKGANAIDSQIQLLSGAGEKLSNSKWVVLVYEDEIGSAIFQKSGKVVFSDTSKKNSNVGNWVLNDNSVVITWKNGFVDNLIVGDRVLSGKNNKGDKLTYKELR